MKKMFVHNFSFRLSRCWFDLTPAAQRSTRKYFFIIYFLKTLSSNTFEPAPSRYIDNKEKEENISVIDEGLPS